MILIFCVLVFAFVGVAGTSPSAHHVNAKQGIMRRQKGSVVMKIDEEGVLVPEIDGVSVTYGGEQRIAASASGDTTGFNLEELAVHSTFAQAPCRTYVPPKVVPIHRNCYMDAAGSQLNRTCDAENKANQKDFDDGMSAFKSFWQKQVSDKNNLLCGLQALDAWATAKSGIDSASYGGNLVKLGLFLSQAAYGLRKYSLPTDAAGLTLAQNVQPYLEQFAIKLVADGWSGNMYADPAAADKPGWTNLARTPINGWANVPGWFYWAGNMVLGKTYHVIRIMATLKTWKYPYASGGGIGKLPTNDQVKAFYLLNIKTQTSNLKAGKSVTDYGAVKFDPSGNPFYMGDIWREARAAAYTSDSLIWLSNAVTVLKESFDFDLRLPFGGQLCVMLSTFNRDSRSFYRSETGKNLSPNPKTVSEC